MAESCKVTTEPTKLRDYYSEKAKSDLVVWGFELEGQGPVELHKKPGNEPPAKDTMILVEDKWQGDFNGEPFTRIKLANEGGFSGGAQRGGGSKNPDERRSIERQVAAKGAVEMVVALIAHSEQPVTAANADVAFQQLFDAVDAKIAGGS